MLAAAVMARDNVTAYVNVCANVRDSKIFLEANIGDTRCYGKKYLFTVFGLWAKILFRI